MQFVTDINEIFKLLSQSCGETVYKTVGTDEEGNDVAVPVFTLGLGFYDTVEGCTLSHCDRDTCDAVRMVFSRFTEEEKRKLSFSPKEGEFTDRANFWSDRLKPALTRKQHHIAMRAILHWYIHIKSMRVMQEGGTTV